MFAATAKKLFDFHKTGGGFSAHELKLLALGNAIAFVVALFAIRSFINFLSKFGFRVFGYYRIAVGLAIILCCLMGYKLEIL